MALQTPKLDWASTDFLNVGDYNRIVYNLKQVHTLLNANNIQFEIEEMENKTYSSKALADLFNAIENNLEKINENSYELDIGSTRNYKPNGATIDFEEVTRIETAILELYQRIEAQNNNNTAPLIELSSTYGDYATSKTYTIEGTIVDNGNGVGTAKLYKPNGSVVKLPLGNNNSFSVNVTLNPNENIFKIKAIDVDGNPRILTFNKFCDDTLPVISISSPSSGEVISQYTRTFTITGSVVDSLSGIQEVTVNNSPITLTNGTFTFTTGSGTANYVIKATDNADNVATKTVKVVRENYNYVIHGGNTPASGDVTYQEWSRCSVCGAYAEERKYRANGQHASGGYVFGTCPNYPHYKYTISIT